MSLEKTCRDFRPVPTQTGLYNHRRWLGCGIRDSLFHHSVLVDLNVSMMMH